ncbi:hypothetical protein SAMD00019534_031010 [Acytostelium subglobosum LB1]|uniref:hypothetical protein n=1 Tax=Acytostelium subglobosum LB1 TaxID=1410327 RepID=UPI000644D45D|nr:hypothetical protein SAMD00019534_031010 [Acytostelium subglobosum LB1]GAM19926.1 hypothetical protein SAMD00019534_031010 [Acytostelium subglobosum LB1]|eukprot:XP_012756688.1 hypothetical protein SAMD00019534_031010 [Acytostelium subglobosum LB1]
MTGIMVDILAPALTFPDTLSQSEIINGTCVSLGLAEDQVEFLSLGDAHLACLIKNNKFSLDFIESLYQQNELLQYRFEKSTEALSVLQETLMQTTHQLQEKQNVIIQQHQTMSLLSLKERQLSEELNQWKNKYEEELYKRKKNEKRIERMRMPKTTNIGAQPMYLLNSPSTSTTTLTVTSSTSSSSSAAAAASAAASSAAASTSMSPYLERELERNKDREMEYQNERQMIEQVVGKSVTRSPSISPSTSSTSILALGGSNSSINIINTPTSSASSSAAAAATAATGHIGNIHTTTTTTSTSSTPIKLNTSNNNNAYPASPPPVLLIDQHADRKMTMLTSPPPQQPKPQQLQQTPQQHQSPIRFPVLKKTNGITDSPSTPKSSNHHLHANNANTTPMTDILINCRLCTCSMFRETQLKWVCECGHFGIKHHHYDKTLSPRTATMSNGMPLESPIKQQQQ